MSTASVVARGAGIVYGALLKLAKRELAFALKDSEVAMLTVSVEKATGLFEAAVSLIQKREGCTRTKAYDLALADPVARSAYDMQRDGYLEKMQKLGTPDAPDAEFEWPGGTPHGSSSSDPEHPHTESRHDAGSFEDDRRARELRALHPHKALKVFQDAADEIRAANPHLSRGQCQDIARREFPHLWQRAKEARGVGKLSEAIAPHGVAIRKPEENTLDQAAFGRSPTMLPRSHDGNVARARGPYHGMGPGRPY